MTVITISRQYGSGGDELARRVCVLLGCRYFDKQAVQDAASRYEQQEKAPAQGAQPAQEPREPNLLERLLGSDDIIRDAMEARAAADGASSMEGAGPEEERFALMIRRAVEEAYEQGDVIILGRAGQVTLQDRPGVLHVRITAPFETRVAHVRAREGLDEHEAEDRITQRDRAAAEFIHTSYSADWDDPLLYHLVINTGKWTLDDAAAIIAAAARRIPEPGPR